MAPTILLLTMPCMGTEVSTVVAVVVVAAPEDEVSTTVVATMVVVAATPTTAMVASTFPAKCVRKKGTR
jgi:hypothetical protein